MAQLHADDKAGHGQEYVTPDEHVHVVDEVDDEGGQLEAQLNVVHDGAALLPHAGLVPASASGSLAADVVQMECVPNYHVQCADAQKNYLRN